MRSTDQVACAGPRGQGSGGCTKHRRVAHNCLGFEAAKVRLWTVLRAAVVVVQRNGVTGSPLRALGEASGRDVAAGLEGSQQDV